MSLKFTKMHGTGNDFIMINGLKNDIETYSDLAINLCDRHFGIGADGIIIILAANENNNDYRMRIFNSDGTEAEMCGNGIRCFAHYLYNKNLIDRKKLNIETLAGIIKPEIIDTSKKNSKIKVDMGYPEFATAKIPVDVEDDDFISDYKITIEDKNFSASFVSMGNPHTIFFLDEIMNIPLEKWGSKIENLKIFPEKTNVEFIKILNKNEIEMKVWERGTGITLACGTGASAAVVSGIKKGLLGEKVKVYLPGGELEIEWHGENVYMTGPAETVFTGEFFI